MKFSSPNIHLPPLFLFVLAPKFQDRGRVPMSGDLYFLLMNKNEVPKSWQEALHALMGLVDHLGRIP